MVMYNLSAAHDVYRTFEEQNKTLAGRIHCPKCVGQFQNADLHRAD